MKLHTSVLSDLSSIIVLQLYLHTAEVMESKIDGDNCTQTHFKRQRLSRVEGGLDRPWQREIQPEQAVDNAWVQEEVPWKCRLYKNFFQLKSWWKMDSKFWSSCKIYFANGMITATILNVLTTNIPPCISQGIIPYVDLYGRVRILIGRTMFPTFSIWP